MKSKKLATGHYSVLYKGFAIDVSKVSNTWYARVECGTDYEKEDQLNSEGPTKHECMLKVTHKIDLL